MINTLSYLSFFCPADFLKYKKENVVKGRRLTQLNIIIYGKSRCKGVVMGFCATTFSKQLLEKPYTINNDVFG